MPAKKSHPDAKAMPIASIGMALKQKGGTNSESPVTIIHDALNGSGSSKKGSIMSIKGGDIKTDIAIPSVKEQKSAVDKQMKGNREITKKQKGG
jgi:hypothetical protein